VNSELRRISTALAALNDAELHALIDASRGAPPVAYGLLAWIDGTCEWELNRRAGHEYELLPPEAAIDPSEDAVSVDAAIAMRATFAQDSSAVRAMFKALVALLTGGGQKKQ
jgi:hypothetical protein